MNAASGIGMPTVTAARPSPEAPPATGDGAEFHAALEDAAGQQTDREPDGNTSGEGGPGARQGASDGAAAGQQSEEAGTVRSGRSRDGAHTRGPRAGTAGQQTGVLPPGQASFDQLAAGGMLGVGNAGAGDRSDAAELPSGTRATADGQGVASVRPLTSLDGSGSGVAGTGAAVPGLAGPENRAGGLVPGVGFASGAGSASGVGPGAASASANGVLALSSRAAVASLKAASPVDAVASSGVSSSTGFASSGTASSGTGVAPAGGAGPGHPAPGNLFPAGPGGPLAGGLPGAGTSSGALARGLLPGGRAATGSVSSSGALSGSAMRTSGGLAASGPPDGQASPSVVAGTSLTSSNGQAPSAGSGSLTPAGDAGVVAGTPVGGGGAAGGGGAEQRTGAEGGASPGPGGLSAPGASSGGATAWDPSSLQSAGTALAGDPFTAHDPVSSTASGRGQSAAGAGAAGATRHIGGAVDQGPASGAGLAGNVSFAAAVPTSSVLSTASAAASGSAPGSYPSLPQQLSQPMISLARSDPGDHVLQVRVAPDDLGPVTVQAHVTDGGVRIELFAPSDSARDALRQILPDLRRDLSQASANGSVDLSDRNAPNADSGTQTQRDWGTPSDGGRRDLRDERQDATTTNAPRLSSAHVLDVLV